LVEINADLLLGNKKENHGNYSMVVSEMIEAHGRPDTTAGGTNEHLKIWGYGEVSPCQRGEAQPSFHYAFLVSFPFNSMLEDASGLDFPR
jgi:hypothetical protein